MSRYHLTEAYGKLYNPRITEEHYYDNLKFVDYLQTEQIQEVMESLIWEFMDYGDTLGEAVDTLTAIFTDDEILLETLDTICEATVTTGGSAQYHKERGATLAGEARRQAASDRLRSQTKARRASRGNMFSVAIRGAKKAVEGSRAFSKERWVQGAQNNLTSLGQVGTEAQQAAQAAAQRVGRTGRGILGAITGAYRGAKRGGRLGYKAASAAPAPAAPAPAAPAPYPDPGQRHAAIHAAADRNRAARNRATTAPVPAPADTPLAARMDAAGRRLPKGTGAGKRKGSRRAADAAKALKAAAATATVAPTPPATKPPARSFGSKASQEQKKKTAAAVAKVKAEMEAREAARKQRKKKQVNASFDYDLLTQYMIEDIIYEGFAQTEEEALYILECMSEENLNELASTYLAD